RAPGSGPVRGCVPSSLRTCSWGMAGRWMCGPTDDTVERPTGRVGEYLPCRRSPRPGAARRAGDDPGQERCHALVDVVALGLGDVERVEKCAPEHGPAVDGGER